MKKHTLLMIAAGATLAFAACNNGENNTTKEQIDSTVTARVDTMKNKLDAKADSAINAVAKMRADSMMHADSMATATAKKAGTIMAKDGMKEVRHTTKSGTTAHSAGTRVIDRPGATDAQINGQTEKPKSVSDRPGATNVNR